MLGQVLHLPRPALQRRCDTASIEALTVMLHRAARSHTDSIVHCCHTWPRQPAGMHSTSPRCC